MGSFALLLIPPPRCHSITEERCSIVVVVSMWLLVLIHVDSFDARTNDVGRLLSRCVIERKHRDVKRIAFHVHRNAEHTALLDMLNAQVEHMTVGRDLFASEFFVNPATRITNDWFVSSVYKAVCHAGELNIGDVV